MMFGTAHEDSGGFVEHTIDPEEPSPNLAICLHGACSADFVGSMGSLTCLLNSLGQLLAVLSSNMEHQHFDWTIPIESL